MTLTPRSTSFLARSAITLSVNQTPCTLPQLVQLHLTLLFSSLSDLRRHHWHPLHRCLRADAPPSPTSYPSRIFPRRVRFCRRRYRRYSRACQRACRFLPSFGQPGCVLSGARQHPIQTRREASGSAPEQLNIPIPQPGQRKPRTGRPHQGVGRGNAARQ